MILIGIPANDDTEYWISTTRMSLSLWKLLYEWMHDWDENIHTWQQILSGQAKREIQPLSEMQIIHIVEPVSIFKQNVTNCCSISIWLEITMCGVSSPSPLALPPHFCFTWRSCQREEKTGFQLLISFSENMVVEDELDYLEISTNNQTVDTPPCSCPSSTVRKWKPTLPNVIVIVIVIAIDTDIFKFNFFIQVVPYTELCLEGIAIPLLGGAGILGNVAAVVVLRFIIIIIIIVTKPRSLCGPINFRECLGILLRAYILDISFKNPKHRLLKSIHKQTKS